MTECVVTSSALIAVLILLRILFQGKISKKVQYALWGLVLIRLMLPFSLLRSPISIMNIVDPERLTQPMSDIRVYSDYIGHSELTPDEARQVGKGTLQEISGAPIGSGKEHLQSYTFMDTLDVVLPRVLKALWLVGAAAAGLCFVIVNVLFARKLRKTRKACVGLDCPLPVYVSDAVVSPCLSGVFRPAVYLMPKALGSGERLKYVLAHELCHFRHGDHVWSFLRGLCLAAYWWNPLVWAAAVLSRTDGEMACDEAVLKRFGEESRFEYGKTLIEMIAVRKPATGLLCAATTMASGKRGIMARLKFITKRPKTLIPALAVTLLLVALCVGCTFTGAKKTQSAAEKALNQLMSSITYSDSQARFTVPAGYMNTEDWDIRITGRTIGEGQDTDLYADVNDNKAWVRGKTYVIATGGVYETLTLTAALPDEKGGIIQKSGSLMAQPGYSLRRYGSGEVTVLTGDGEQLAKDIIADFMLKSAAWPAADLSTIEECWQLSVSYPNADSTDYYAFQMDGYAYLQRGTDGQRSRINNSLYAQLAALASDRPDQSTQEQYARDYINTVIEDYQKAGVAITDSKITALERSAVYKNILDYPVELWRLEYRLLPKDMSKVVLTGGMKQENGWLAPSSAAQPYLIMTLQNGEASYLGVLLSLSFEEEGGMENALRVRLENSRLAKPETYPGYHYTVSFLLSDGAEARLILSQPARKGSGGIWCAERWYEGNGVLHLTSPDGGGSAAEYYEALQSACDSGHRPGLLDPAEAARGYIGGILGQSTDHISLSEKYSGVDTGVIVWHLVNTICSSPGWSSNPADYIKAHQADYDMLVSSADTTLRAVCAEFLRGGQTGLRAHVMCALMRDILGKEIPELGTAETAQAWFDQWRAWAVRNGDEIKKNRPKTAALLDML